MSALKVVVNHLGLMEESGASRCGRLSWRMWEWGCFWPWSVCSGWLAHWASLPAALLPFPVWHNRGVVVMTCVKEIKLKTNYTSDIPHTLLYMLVCGIKCKGSIILTQNKHQIWSGMHQYCISILHLWADTDLIDRLLHWQIGTD